MKDINKGTYPTMITPYHDDNTVDYEAVKNITNWYIDNGCTGIFAVCQSSEMIYLSLDEKIKIAKTVVETVKASGKNVSVVASGHNSDDMNAQIEALSLGITTQLQKLLTPFLTFLFPNLKNQKAKEYISTNIVANILGLGWAATPSGLKAMEELQKDNPVKNTATNEMCSFLILNISSLQLIPINIIAYRSQYGSVNPSKILIPGLIATLGSTIVAVIYIKWKDRKR